MFQIDKSVMLLIDVQGQLAQLMVQKENLFKSLEIFIQGMQQLHVPILWVEQMPENLGRTTDLISRHLGQMSPIEKCTFSCCRDDKFMTEFKSLGKTQVFLTGIETHICVFQTGADLLSQGYEVQIVSDCVSSRTRGNKEVGIQRILQLGGQITSVEMALFELMKSATGDVFRKIVRLVK